ncbi:MAG: SET domain-containing protein [Hyphomonadaceae bacterium]
MADRPFRIGRSKTGLGLFATEAIPKGVRIFEYTGKVVSNEESSRMTGTPRYLCHLNKNQMLDGSPRSNIGRYANHSCAPNSEMYVYRGHVYVRSIRVIKVGEEITYDYGKEYFDALIGKEKCLCTACVKRRARKASQPATRKADVSRTQAGKRTARRA